METEIKYTNTENQRQPPQPPQAAVSKKKRGLLHIIKLALFMLKHKSTTRISSKSSLWRRIVGAMRSLHSHQQHIEHHPSSPSPLVIPPLSPQSTSNVKVSNAQTVDNAPTPMSPHMAPLDSPLSSNSCATMSQFASAQNLQELDRSCNDENVGDGMHMIDNDGDVMIDARAEEYIAHFYEEMKLQRFKSVNRVNQLNECNGSG